MLQSTGSKLTLSRTTDQNDPTVDHNSEQVHGLIRLEPVTNRY